jgi:hypothetical protein
MAWQCDDPGAEVRRVIRVLEKTVSMAEHASLTGSMAGGSEFAVRSYNSMVQHLSEIGEIPPALFPPLAEGASMDEVGIASAQLAEYLRGDAPKPEQGEGQPAGLHDIVFFNIGGLGEIGELIRENLPHWLRGKRGAPESETGRTERPESTEQSTSTAGEAASGAGETAAAQNRFPAATAAGFRPGPAAGNPAPRARPALSSRQVHIEELRPESSQTPQAR